MTEELFLKMEDLMALSWINTKLRDQYYNLDNLCEDLEFDQENIINKFQKIEYTYIKEQNKFM